MTSLGSWQPGLNPPQPSTPPTHTLQATTGIAGVPKVNGTPNILSWTAPNDGGMHRFIAYMTQHVTVLEVGGAIQVTFPGPDGLANAAPVPFAGGSAVGVQTGQTTGVVAPGGTVTIRQSTALTGGTSQFFAEIWGS